MGFNPQRYKLRGGIGTSLFVVACSFFGLSEPAGASTLNIKLVNSDSKSPFFPIEEIKITLVKKKDGAKIETELEFEFKDEKGKRKVAIIHLTKGQSSIKICNSLQTECNKPEVINPSVRLPENGTSILRMTIEPPDIRDAENGGVPNLVITRAGLGKPNEDGSSDRDYNDFPQDPTYRLRLIETDGNFVPVGVTQVTHVVDAKTGTYKSTSITSVAKNVRHDDGSYTWSPDTLMVSDTSYASSKWPLRRDGSLIGPDDPDWDPVKANRGSRPAPAKSPIQ
jgi:hypothetical protein